MKRRLNPSRFPGAARVALRLAGVAVLAGGGIALGRGVVTLSSARTSTVEVAGASARRGDALTVEGAVASEVGERQPLFTSSLRSWMASPSSPAPSPPSSAPATQVEPRPQMSASDMETAASHIVSEGDTLSDIADWYAVDVEMLARVNQLSDVNLLLPGARLLIPGAKVGAAGEALPAMRRIDPTPAPKVPTPQPARAAAPTPASAAPPASQEVIQGAATPDGAVRTFYAHVLQRQFGQAAGLWSASMRGSYSPTENINQRFAQTQSLTLRQADVVEVDTAAGRATVAVQLTEVVGPGMETRRYVGHWYLVRGPGGWLLDKPALQLN